MFTLRTMFRKLVHTGHTSICAHRITKQLIEVHFKQGEQESTEILRLYKKKLHFLHRIKWKEHAT